MRIISLFLLLITSCCFANNLLLTKLKLPPGFSISIYASPVPGARSMTLGTSNIVFVGSIDAGKVYAIIPNSNLKTQVITIASGLNMPNGVAFYQGNLYVAENDRILRFDDIEKHLDNPPKPVVISNALPNKIIHGWRYLRIGPDKKLYFSIGVPCNICKNEDSRLGTISRMNLDGSGQEIYAKGIRNSVGFDWDPDTYQLWFTDNGRDWMGDNLPPDELNHAPKSNLNFGFPYCYGNNILDPEFGKGFSCSQFTPPVVELPAHVAALGMIFYNGSMFPSDYRKQIFIAEHGSWNRSKKTGYQVIAVKLSQNKVVSVKPFISGWMQNENVFGRPVDILEMPDGSLLISDDSANVIYRLIYK